MKTHKKRSKVESSDSDSSTSSSSSNDSAPRKKKAFVKDSRTFKKPESKDLERETSKAEHRDDSRSHKRVQNERETHRDRRDGQRDYDRRHENSRDYRDDRDKRNDDRDRRSDDKEWRSDDRERRNGESRIDNRERRTDDNYRRPRFDNEQRFNHNRNNYEQGRDRHRRSDDSYNRRRDQDDNQRNYNKFDKKNRERSRSRSFDHANAKWGKDGDNNAKKDKGKPVEKEKPNFGLSGKLTEERNTYRGIVIKYSEPPEARKPKRRWRLYPFKGEKALQTLYIHRESAYLIGRERKVVDLPVDHPSCSKQHAALQYRLVPFTRDDGSAGKRVRPYLIDLESANGTFINNKKIEPKKYIELLEQDVIKFGFSSREYVLLHENSKGEEQDDDVKQEEEEIKKETVKEEVEV